MAFDGSALAHLVKRVPPVVREGPHLARPAAFFDRLRPPWADEDVGPVDLVYRAVAWAVMRDLLLVAADAHGEVLSRHPCHGAHAGALEMLPPGGTPPCRAFQRPPHRRRLTIFPSARIGSIGARSRSSRPICPSSIPTIICGTGPTGVICSMNCWRIRRAATTSSPPCSCRRV